MRIYAIFSFAILHILQTRQCDQCDQYDSNVFMNDYGAVHLTLRMLRSIRLTNQKIEFYKLTNQKMLRSIRSAKWPAAYVQQIKRIFDCIRRACIEPVYLFFIRRKTRIEWRDIALIACSPNVLFERRQYFGLVIG